MALAKDYIELNYGKSYLTPKEQRQLNYQICTGAHKECKLHFSDGLLSRPDASAEGTSPAEEQPPLQDSADTYQMEYARRVLTENLEILKANQLMTRQNILSLADILKRALLTREEKEIFPTNTEKSGLTGSGISAEPTTAKCLTGNLFRNSLILQWKS